MVGIGSVVGSSIKAISTVLIESLFGFYLCRRDLLPPAIQRGLSKIYINVFLPCLLLTSTPPEVTPENMKDWWPLILFPGSYIFIGMLFGYIYAKVAGIEGDEMRFLMACTGFGNAVSLPLALADALGHGVPFLRLPGDKPSDVANRGISYVSFINLFNQLLTWTIAYQLLEPQLNYAVRFAGDHHGMPLLDGEKELESSPENLSPPDSPSPDSPSPPVSPQQSDNSFFNRAGSHLLRTVSKDVDDDTSSINSAKAIDYKRHSVKFRPTSQSVHSIHSATGKPLPIGPPPPKLTLRDRVERIMKPPVWALLIALVVGLISTIKFWFFAHPGEDLSDVPVGFVTQSVKNVGACAVPTTLILLGAKLSNGPLTGKGSDADTTMFNFRKVIIGALVIRLFLMGFFGLIFVYTFHGAGLLLDDPIFRMVLMIQSCTPIMVNLIAICVLHEAYENEMGSALFYAYILGIATVTAWVTVYLTFEETTLSQM